MAEVSAKERVLAKYPDAVFRRFETPEHGEGQFCGYVFADSHGYLSSGMRWNNEAASWADAWRTIQNDAASKLPPEGEATKPTCAKCNELARLLIECRDALPAISLSSARLHNVGLRLADRIEAALKPWEVPIGTERAI